MGSRYAYAVMSSEDEDDVLASYFNDLAEGRVRSRWIDYRVPKRLLYPNPARFVTREYAGSWINGWRKHLRDRKSLEVKARRTGAIVKCIRANLLAGWLSKKVGFQTALVVRHPCATIESQLRGGGAWKPERIMARYKSNEKLHEITGNRYTALLERNLSQIESMALRWTIENQLAVEQSVEQEYFVVCYEHLLDDPQKTWPRVCDSLGLSVVPESSDLRKPSQQASGAYISGCKDSKKSTPRWQSVLSKKQIREIQGILDETDFTLYRAMQRLPAKDL